MKRLYRSLGWVTVAILAGCAAARRPQPAAIFFPAAPELPRIQYLTSFSGLRDIVEQSAFDRFVVGESPDVSLNKPYGVAIHGGKIYVCDTNATVGVFDLEQKSFAPLRGAVGPGQLSQPINISIEADGTKYVADPVRGQVVAFAADDGFLRAYGTPGGWRPVDAVAFEDRLYVADIEHGRVQIFDKQSARWIKNIGDRGDTAARLERPTNLAFDTDGYLYVSDMGRFQIVKLDRDGHFKASIGKPGDNLGHFARPKGIAIDRDGRLYAVDASFNNVQIFSPGGRLLLFFGGGGEQPGQLVLPAQVTIEYDHVRYFERYAADDFQIEHLIFVTSQFGPRPVSVFAYGRSPGKQYPSDEELLKQIDERRAREREKARAK